MIVPLFEMEKNMLIAFISYKHADQNIISQIKSIRLNTNHRLMYDDGSLPKPIYNNNGDIITRPPNDPASKSVKDAIKPLLEKADKLLVLIGKDTHSSLWVQWEIDVFTSKFGNKDILFMRIPNDTTSGLPKNAKHHELHNWNLDLLTRWLES